VDRTYQLQLHRDDRPGAQLVAQLYRVTDDGGLKLVADIDASYAAFGVSGAFEHLAAALITHEDARGELP
jgi:hypothetical protein